MVKVNILIAGIGGQGIITLGKILANAALNAGLKAIVAETHGLAQRGGAVNVHVRIGDKVYAPLIPFGEADYLLGLEAMEVLRNINYASKYKTVIIINKSIIRPVLPKVKVLNFEEIDKKLNGFKKIWISANEIAENTKNPRGVNIA
ncbi:MAG: 2-oxoacid:acceptor oxidoreductase family protein, partial [Sulfolobaceae archaeon]